MALKNQSIVVTYTAFDASTGLRKTGDVANHTIYVIKDGTAAAATNAPSEVDATHAPGEYAITLTAAEMNANTVVVTGKSSTANIEIVPVKITTERGVLTDADTVINSVYTRIGAPAGASVSADIASVQADTDNIQTRLPAALVSGRMDSHVNDIAADAITAAAIAADAGTEIANAVLDQTIAPPTAAPSAPYTLRSIVAWLLAIAKFRRTQTATTETVYQDDGATPAATAAKSDSGTTFSRGEYS